MSFLVCFGCRNRLSFVQVSQRGDAREISLVNLRYRATPWNEPDDRPPGIYCADCGADVDADDAATLGLADDRVDFVPYDRFDAASLYAEFTSLVPAAEWTRLDIPETPARFARLSASLAPPVAEAVERLGKDFYLHQAKTIDAALARKNVVVATAAGSGKSLGYQVPTLEQLSRNSVATALLVFPMRALVGDQMKSLAQFGWNDTQPDGAVLRLQLTEGSDPITVVRHDGPALDGDRKMARSHARIVLTTPDSLHHAILAHSNRRYRDGTAWDRFFRGLRLVVLDEVHFYRGAFGSAVAQVLRRLRRAADAEGGDIRWIASSATIGNPAEHAERLTGVEGFELIGPDDDGAGRSKRIVALCNPPHLTEAAKQRRDSRDVQQRQSPTTVGLELMAHALAGPGRLPVRTICFARSRSEVQMFAKRVAGRIEAEYHRRDVASAVGSYTATLLAEDRVEQEERLKDGRLLGLVSTNALELGIDIPDLSTALLVGFPGQLSSFRQRAGRVGRRGEGLAVLVVADDPLQQHLVRTPSYLSDGAPENVVISTDHPEIVDRYGIQPAAAESRWGLCADDTRYFGHAVRDWISEARRNGAVPTIRNARTYWKCERPNPHADLRSPGGSGSYAVVARQGRDREPVGTIDSASGPRDCFVDAVWVGGLGEDTFVVTNVDHTAKEVHVRRASTDYVTRGLVHDTLDVTSESRTDDRRRYVIGDGVLTIRRSVFGYKKVFIAGGHEETVNDISGWGPRTFSTRGLWLDVTQASAGISADRHEAGIVSVEHVLLSLLPAFVAADPVDFDSHASSSRIYLFDASPLGIGLAAGAYERMDELLRLALDVVESCTCADGCPGCVYLSRRPLGNAIVSRVVARDLLAVLAA